MSWSVNELQEWDEKIKKVAEGYKLDWYPINYEICNYYSMIGHMAYHGMPTHYDHWSYGKAFERTHQAYNAGVEGLPYELIINSHPSIAYLMRENPLYLQILIMAHCVGHSDFFKNNRMFKNTRPESVIGRFRAAKKRIQEYVEDPTIGIDRVEEVIDACHALQFQINRDGSERRTHKEMVEYYRALSEKDYEGRYVVYDIETIPLEADADILGFISEHGKMPDWKRDIIAIVRDEAYYFMPQMQTKIMNEGWASFWHYTICHDLELGDKHHLPFIKMHNAVIRPHLGGLNPYHLGFVIFQDIKKRFGLEECFIARESLNDVSFIRQYLTAELAMDLGLFSWSEKKRNWTIDEISDDDGWKKVRDSLCASVGDSGMPVIKVELLEDNGRLVLRHDHDGRDLILDYSDKVVDHARVLWGHEVVLHTSIEGDPWEI
jgi:stage V sporulation protein R